MFYFGQLYEYKGERYLGKSAWTEIEVLDRCQLLTQLNIMANYMCIRGLYITAFIHTYISQTIAYFPATNHWHFWPSLQLILQDKYLEAAAFWTKTFGIGIAKTAAIYRYFIQLHPLNQM